MREREEQEKVETEREMILAFKCLQISVWDELSVGMGCPLGWVVRWDGLSVGMSCPLG